MPKIRTILVPFWALLTAKQDNVIIANVTQLFIYRL